MDWDLINGYSHHVSSTWDKELDLLFIDSSHHYEDVKRDFNQWSPFVVPNGIIILHDSRKDNLDEDPDDQIFSRGWVGPTRFVEELRALDEFEIVDSCYSLTVVKRKSAVAKKGKSK